MKISEIHAKINLLGQMIRYTLRRIQDSVLISPQLSFFFLSEKKV